MKFQLQTLIDITETQARFNKEDSAWKQQQNFMTVVQTIGLRVNISYKDSVNVETVAVKGMGFGTNYRGDHTVWTFDFVPDFPAAVDLEMLIRDFDLIPIIIGLDETVNIKSPVFETKNAHRRNIVFKIYAV